MEITCNLGKIYVDDYSFNCESMSEVLGVVFRDTYSVVGNNTTPYSINLHNCRFMNTLLQLKNDIIISNDNYMIYSFGEKIHKFKGEYPLVINVSIEFAKFYNCTFTDVSNVCVNLKNEKGEKLANVIILLDYIKLPYIDTDKYPSWECRLTYGYKILRKSISSHINRYYLCKLTFPNDAISIKTINGDIRSNKATVNSIIQLAEINSYKYSDDEVYEILDHTNVDEVIHTPFAGNYNNNIRYSVGRTITVPEVERISYKSTGPGIYCTNTITEAIHFLNRVIFKDNLIMNTDDGYTKLLSNELLKEISNI